jgi:ketosteroid isomerase-like protein
MSEENVEIVRRANAAYAAGGMDAALSYFTDDTVLCSIPEWPDDPEYHGHDGLRRLDRQWRDNFDDFGFDAQELRDAGHAVVSLHELTGRTKGSRIPMTMHIGAVVSEFADGRIGVQRLFPSWESALQAAGLSE